MSAPDTNTQKQAERHRGPLTGMLGVVLFAVVLLVGLVIFLASRGGTPEAAAQVDGRTGESSAESGAGNAAAGGGSTDAVANEAAPVVAPEETTGADASANEPADANPTDSQVSTPAGEEPAAAPSADD